MKKGHGETPRMLPFVVQAVTDLKDMNGSTMRKILDQVHTAINITNVKPKPRNVVMQVKRALKHAVDTGVLRHKAGKYRLILDEKATKKSSGLKIRTNRALSRRRRRRQRKLQKSKKIRRRGRHANRYTASSASGTSACSVCDHRPTSDSLEKKSRNKRRRRRSLAKKTVQFSRSGRKTKNKGRFRRLRRATPMPSRGRARRKQPAQPDPEPMDTKTDEGEECPAITNEIKNLVKAFAKDCMNQEGGDVDPSVENVTPTLVEIPPECDNPECLCNLKQEPSEDGNYDNCNEADFYQ